MKLKIILIAFLFPSLCYGQLFKSFNQLADRVNISLTSGTISIRPLAENAIRVQFTKTIFPVMPELVFTSKSEVPDFNVRESASSIEISTKQVKVVVDKTTGTLYYLDNAGKVFLSEKPNTRLLVSDSVMGEPCVIAGQSFESQPDEFILGLGQFQDGHFNLKDVTRKLTQVNTQISIPFIYSNKGYGLLWHQYGLTDFNPADSLIHIEKQNTVAEKSGTSVDATTATGTQKIKQEQDTYIGKFIASTDGMYSIMLNLGDMGNRHYVSIDGNACIDQSNFWLPPTASAQISLNAGEHSIEVICKSNNTPRVTYKHIDGLTTFRSPNAKMLDYVVFYGPKADDVIATYRNLSGNVPMLPLWAYGFWQCRERYSSSQHLTETVKEFRKRNIPMDAIVQDWQYWGKYGWGVMKMDETNYPDPAALMNELHSMNAHFNISVWENVNQQSDIGKNHVANNLYIPESPWLDVTNPAAREAHWDAINKNLFSYGVDSWWLDATEPENDALHGKKLYLGAGDSYRLTYPLFVNQAVYEGQRKTSQDKRVCILTRSAFPGQQRYGTINWSGDIGGTWDSYARQIVAGLNFAITGMPYWTTDIGGFFRPGKSQYTDEKYNELLMRWYQWGVFNPIFRVHGYQTETEPWKNGSVVESNIRQLLDLRYRLMPYIYSTAWQVTQNGSTIMRPLVMDFKDDTTAINQPYEYMFGSSFLVAPVTKPGITMWNVYLPQTVQWYNFWTGKRFDGGQTVKTLAPLNSTPVFVKAGSIIPMGKLIQYTGQKLSDTIEIRIYKGANGKFNLYEDEGNNYNYEKGNYTIIPFEWNEKNQCLLIGNRQGKYAGFLKKRLFNIVLVSESEGLGTFVSPLKKKVIYKGKKIEITVK
ncbi:MAG: glycoside hydrolase family 31 protein [Paludibacter sp.]|nr:glycoside hydrolase family 31 protein [Paludibacter sp.]